MDRDGQDAPGEGRADGAHPYRPDDARTLDPEIERCVRWHRVRWRRGRFAGAVTHVVVIAGCIALGRLVHWSGWIVLGIVGAMIGVVTVVAVWAAREAARFDARLREDPGELAWMHVETEAIRGRWCRCDLQLRDGTSSSIYVPAEMARRLAEVAGHGRFHVTRTPEARTAFETESELRRLEQRLRRPESELASQIGPHVLAAIEGRSCAELPERGVAALKAALWELSVVLGAAEIHEASRRRIAGKARPQVTALLDRGRSDPYSERATTVLRTIERAFEAARK